MDNFSEGSVVCMRTANVQKTLDESDLLSIPRSHVKSEDKILREGDLLVSTANSWNLVGKCCWVPALGYAATVGGFIAALRGDKSKVDLRYLYHWFNSPDTQVDARNCGRQTTNISNMDIGRCLELKIPLPPLFEQRRIAAILDKADALRAKRREAIAKLNQLLQSVFLEMFGDPVTNPRGWPEKLLSEVVNEGTIVTYGIVQAGEEFPGGIPYIRTGDIVAGEIVEAGLRRTSPEIAEKFSRSRVETGDIVMSIRATVGTTALVPASLNGANLTQGTARIAVGEKNDRNFVLHHLRTIGTQRWIKRQVKGATFQEITLGRLRELPMIIPPRDLQDRFGLICERLNGSATASQSSSAKLENLFGSLQYRAFTGTL
jgi:type I restriction enzyme S subunit